MLVLMLGALYARFGNVPAVAATIGGVAIAAAGLIIGTGFKMAAANGARPAAVLFALLAFVAVGILRWPLPVV